MKFFTAATLLVAALISAVVCVPFLPVAKDNPNLFRMEVRMAAKGGGHVQIYFDTGNGFAEAQSVAQPLIPSGEMVTYGLPLRPGTYRQFRFDPIDGASPVSVASLHVVAATGRTVREIPLSTLVPLHDIAKADLRNGQLEIEPTAKSNDPQFLVPLDAPLVLHPTTAELFRGAGVLWAVIFATLAVVLFALDRAPALRQKIARSARYLGGRPTLSICILGAAAVIASSYPVVFLGKSFVSPNMGTPLLYEDFPTLPGYRDATPGEVMGADIGAVMWQHVPLSMVEAKALRHGEIPVWNRYNSAGTPLLGQGQSMFGDPVHLLVLLADGAAWAWDLKYLVAKWLFAVGLGLIVLALVDERAASAAFLVAVAAPFIGFFVYRFNHPAFFSLCYAPWPLYCWVRIVRSTTLRSFAMGAAGLMVANLALMNSGTAKEAYMLLLTMNLAGLCVLLSSPEPWRIRLLKLIGAGWAGVLFGLITAPIWATFLHSLHHAYTSYNSVSAYQIQPSLLLGIFDEAFYRPLTPANQTFSPSLNFLLLLGFLYFVATLRTHLGNRAVLTLAIVSLLPLSLAFGLVPPEWIVAIPFLGNIAHIDNTFSCALIVLWAILAGVGVATAATRLRSVDGRGDLVVVLLLLGALLFGWIAFGQAVHRPIYGPAFTVNQLGHPMPVAHFLWPYLASLTIASLALLFVARTAAVRGGMGVAGILLAGLCVVVLCWRHGLHAPAVGFEQYVIRPTTRVNFHAKSPAVELVRSTQAAEPSRAYGVRGNFFPGWNDAYGLETIHGPDALMNPMYRELLDRFPGIQRIWDWRMYLEPRNVAVARPYLDALNVRYYLDYRSDQGLLQESLKLVRAGDLDVYESATAWPRAFFSNQVFVYDRLDEFISKLGQPDGRPFIAAHRVDVSRNDTIAALWGNWTERIVTPATNYRVTENATGFSVHAASAGAILVDEAAWPGDARISLNGQKAPIIRLNHAFIGVAVKAPGDYRVEVRYVPAGWYRNLALVGVGTALALLSAWAAYRFGRSRGSVESLQRESPLPA